VQYTFNQKGKVFSESQKTQNQAINPSPLPGLTLQPTPHVRAGLLQALCVKPCFFMKVDRRNIWVGLVAFDHLVNLRTCWHFIEQVNQILNPHSDTETYPVFCSLHFDCKRFCVSHLWHGTPLKTDNKAVNTEPPFQRVHNSGPLGGGPVTADVTTSDPHANTPCM